MGKPIAVPYGERNGALVHVSEVDRGLDCACVCPACGARLVARKGTKTAHHFAHYHQTDCSPETLLHHLAKRLLMQRVLDALSRQEPLPVEWSCPYCHDTHTRNLVKMATRVEVEMNLGPCRPDLTLLDRSGSPVAILEVVVSHQPDDNVRAFASSADVPVVQFNIDSAEDLEPIASSSPLVAATVDRCTRPKCARCGHPLYRATLHVVVAPCWKCTAPMNVAMLEIEGQCMGPDRFSRADIELARKLGVLLKVNYSKTTHSSYLANTCPQCGAFVGAFFVHEYWNLMSPSTGHDAGYLCPDC